MQRAVIAWCNPPADLSPFAFGFRIGICGAAVVAGMAVPVFTACVIVGVFVVLYRAMFR